MLTSCQGCIYFIPIEDAYIGVLNSCELGRIEAEVSPSGCGCELYTLIEPIKDGENNGENLC